MALALYRKYRPRTFSEVIGQEHVTEPLSQALRSGRLHHAYLFSGPRGCGKTSSARILARSLNCAEGPTPDPCGKCDSCRALAPDGPGSIDVLEIDAASHGGVDDARELRERAFFAPASSRYKIYVIDEAHMVSPAGFNALLKLVEEPPEYVKFIFATTEPEKVLGTIKSRTHHYPFRLIPPGVLRPYLEQLTASEGATVEQAVFPLVVRAGGGSARDSLSVLDQLIAGAGAEGVTYARAVSLLGVTDAALIDEMCDALAATDGAAAYATVDRVVEAGHDPRRFASDLLERLRDLIVLQQVPDAVEKGLLDAPSDQLQRMSLQAQRMGQATLSRCADIVHNGLVEMRGTTAPRLLLELIAARMLLPGADDSSGALLQRLERMERRLTLSAGDAPPATAAAAPSPAPAGVPAAAAPAPTEAPARPAPPAAPAMDAAAASTPLAGQGSGAAVPASGSPGPMAAAPVSAPPNAPASAPPMRGSAEQPTSAGNGVAQAVAAPAKAGDPGVLDAAAVRRVWGEILTMVGLKSKKVAAVAREATVRDLDGHTLVLTFKHTAHASLLSSSPGQLQEAIYEVLGGRWQISCEVAGDQRPARQAAPQATPPPSSPAPKAPPAPRSGSVPAARDGGDWPEATRPGGESASASGAGVSGAAGGAGVPSATADAAASAPGTAGVASAPSTAGVVSAPGTAGEAASAGGMGGGAASAPGVPGEAAYGSGTAGAGTHAAGGAPAASGMTAGAASAPGMAGESANGSGTAGAGGDAPGGSGMPGGAPPASGGAGVAASAPGGAAPTAGAAGGAASAPGASAGDAASGTDGGDWPTPARLGGATAPGSDGGDWPTPARLGGATATAVADPAAGSAGPGRSATAPRPSNGAPASDAKTAARNAAARGASAARARAKAPGRAPETSAWADSPPPDEPPYDPEYDGPPKKGGAPAGNSAYEGFDPGDEPLDDVVDEATARQSSEQQAMQLLKEKLGAEKIGEVDLR